MKITTVLKMDIKTAVDYAVNEILVGAVGFFVPTEFGRIPVEVIRRKPTFDTVTTCRWIDSPATKFVMRNKSEQYDWYVEIHYISGMDPILLRVQLIRELTTVMYRSLHAEGRAPKQHLVNALTREYVLAFHGYDIDFNKTKFINAYAKVRGGMAAKLSQSTSKTIKNEMARAFDAEETISNLGKNECMKNYRQLGFSTGSFGNSFYDLMASSLMTSSKVFHEKYDELDDKIDDISAYNLIQQVLK